MPINLKGTSSIGFLTRAQSSSVSSRVTFGTRAQIIVAPPQPVLLSGPTSVSALIVRSFLGPPFAQASDITRKAILCVITTNPDNDLAPTSFLTAFTTTDGGATWGETRGPQIKQLDYSMWQGWASEHWQPLDSPFGSPTPPATNSNGTLPSFSPLIGADGPFGSTPKAANAVREGSSDDIFTINSPYGSSHGPMQMPPGVAPPYHGDQVIDVADLWLYKFNLPSFSWTSLAKCGEFCIIGPGDRYANGDSYSSIDASPEILGISGGVGIARLHAGNVLCQAAFGLPDINSIPYPSGVYGAELIINFDVAGASIVWGYVTDPDANTAFGNTAATNGTDDSGTPPNNPYPPGLAGGNYDAVFITWARWKGVDPISGDIFDGSPQPSIASFPDVFRNRVMRWPKGSRAITPIFSNAAVGSITSPLDAVGVLNFEAPLEDQGDISLYRKSDNYTGGVSPFIYGASGTGGIGNPPPSDIPAYIGNLIVNPSATAWVGVFGTVLGFGPNGNRLRVRQSWFPPIFINPLISWAEPVLYVDSLPQNFSPANGQTAFYVGGTGQPFSPAFQRPAIECSMTSDKNLDIVTMLNITLLEPPNYCGTIYNPYFWRVNPKWPPGGAYIVGKGNFALG